jgi:fumarylacetoacetase
MYEINETHDPNLKSWVESANDPNTDFPIQNLPYCVFRRRDSDELRRRGVLIGDHVFDLEKADDLRLFDDNEFDIEC